MCAASQTACFSPLTTHLKLHSLLHWATSSQPGKSGALGSIVTTSVLPAHRRKNKNMLLPLIPPSFLHLNIHCFSHIYASSHAQFFCIRTPFHTHTLFCSLPQHQERCLATTHPTTTSGQLRACSSSSPARSSAASAKAMMLSMSGSTPGLCAATSAPSMSREELTQVLPTSPRDGKSSAI